MPENIFVSHYSTAHHSSVPRHIYLIRLVHIFSHFCAAFPARHCRAAAKVGGINANQTKPAEFAYENMQVQCNVIKCCHDFHVKKLLFLGSTCIYPRMAPHSWNLRIMAGSTWESCKSKLSYGPYKFVGIQADACVFDGKDPKSAAADVCGEVNLYLNVPPRTNNIEETAWPHLDFFRHG